MADENVETANADSESVTDDIVTGGEVDSLLDMINNASFDDKEPVVEEKEKVPEVVKPVVTTPEIPKTPEPDRGLERIAAKEKEVRELKDSFEKERGQYIKHADLNLNPSKVLQAAGIDPDVLMKTILYEKLPDTSPVKAKLKTELSEVLVNKKLKELDDKIENDKKQTTNAQAQARVYQETVANIESFVGKFKDKEDTTLPTLSVVGKEGADVLKGLIMDELINDATRRYASGESGDPITHEEAAKRIEKRLASLVPFLSKIATKNDTGTTTQANVTTPSNKKKGVVKPGPAQAKTQPDKTVQQEADDLVERIMSGR